MKFEDLKPEHIVFDADQAVEEGKHIVAKQREKGHEISPEMEKLMVSIYLAGNLQQFDLLGLPLKAAIGELSIRIPALKADHQDRIEKVRQFFKEHVQAAESHANFLDRELDYVYKDVEKYREDLEYAVQKFIEIKEGPSMHFTDSRFMPKTPKEIAEYVARHGQQTARKALERLKPEAQGEPDELADR